MKLRLLFTYLILVAALCCPTHVWAAFYYVHDFTCDNCHKAGANIKNIDDTICLNCHGEGTIAGAGLAHYRNPAAPAMVPSREFTVGMASDETGARSAQVAAPPSNEDLQTSHNWSATDYNPAVGASAPADPSYYGRRNYSGALVSCSRCHDPHGLAEDYSSWTANPKLLKTGAGTESDMCLDCHSLWNIPNSANATLSHPVGDDYATVVADTGPGGKNETGKFKTFAPSGEMALAGGTTVSCSTCHGVHHSDSDSSTVDAYSTALKSDGKMLRADGPARTGGTRNGATGTAQLRSNLCQSCHTYKLHGKGLTGDHQIGCLDCHGGHSYNNNNPSAYVLNDQSPDSVPTHIDGVASGPVTVNFSQYLAGTNSRVQWTDSAIGVGGYCEQCHGDVQSGAILAKAAEHAFDSVAECDSCHLHNGTGWTFSFQVDASAATCGACHGFPPHKTVSGDKDQVYDPAGELGGYAYNVVDGPPNEWNYLANSGYYKDEALTAHDTHAGNNDNPLYYFVGQAGIENCQPCHGPDAGSGAGNHREPGVTETFRDVPFNDVARGITASAGSTLSPTYNNVSCSAVYCHSNGFPRTGPTSASRDYSGTSATPSWENGKDAIFGLAANARCSHCHGNDVTTMGGGQKNNSPAHIKHLSAPYNYDCSVCHVDTASSSIALQPGATDGRAGGKHVNSVVNVDFDPSVAAVNGQLAGDTYTGINATNGTCSTIYCHDPGNTGLQTADWDNGALACDACHATTTIATGSHTKHVSAATGPLLACADCHGTNADAGTHTGHVDGVFTLTPSVCETCHGYDAGEKLPTWGEQPYIDADPVKRNEYCITCHTGTTKANVSGRVAPDKSNALTIGHNKSSGQYPVSNNPAATIDCDACHNLNATLHFNGAADSMRLRTDNGFPATYAGNENQVCDSCHGPAASASKNNITTHKAKNCIACHDVHGDTSGNANRFMVRGNSSDYAGTVNFQIRGDSGSPLTATNSYDEDDGAAGGAGENNADDLCATCHSVAGTSSHNNRDNSVVDHNQGANCFDCHNTHTDPTDAFAGGAGNSCNSCHDFPNATGAHLLHTITGSNYQEDGLPTFDVSDCARCHGDGTNNATFTSNVNNYTYLGEGDQSGTLRHGHDVDRFTILTETVGYNSVDKTCANACHTSTVGDGAWDDANGLDCSACHYYAPAPTSGGNAGDLGGSHDGHFNGSKVCSDCHTVDNGGASLPGDLGHINNRTGGSDLAVIAGMAAAVSTEAAVTRTNMTWSSPTCSSTGAGFALGCHATGAPVWNSGVQSCTQCHTNTTDATVNPTSGLHNNSSAPTVSGQSHDSTVAGGCEACHTTSPSSSHANGTMNPSWPVITVAGSVNTFNDGATPSCATSCHSVGTNWEYLWSTDAFNSDGSECQNCHGTYNNTWNTGVVHNEAGNETRGSSHSAAGSLTYPCGDCHAIGSTNYAFTSGTQDWDAAAGETSNHGDGIITMNNSATNTPDENTRAGCLTGSCHQNDAAHSLLITSTGLPRTPYVVGNDVAADCSLCHGGTVGTSINGYWPNGPNVMGDNGTPDNSGEHDVHVLKIAQQYLGQASIAQLLTNTAGSIGPYNTWTADAKQKEVCSFCHDTPGSDGDHSVTYPADTNNFYTIWNKSSDGDGTYSTGDGSCATTDCHNNKLTPAANGWYDGSTGDCAMCHVDIPNETNHKAHLDSNANGFGLDIDCTFCHDANTDFGLNKAPLDGTHINGSLNVGNGSVSLTYNLGSCGTNDCHNDGTYNPAPAYTWGTPLAGCASCHADTSGGGLNDSHDVHLSTAVQTGIVCTDCHSPATDAAKHIDGNVSFNGLPYGGDVLVNGGSTFGGCSTNSCHNNGKNGSPLDSGYTWGTPIAACGECHNNTSGTLATQMHDEHLNAAGTFGITSIDCDSCHGANATLGTQAGHVDGSIDLLGGMNYSGTPTSILVASNTYGTCTTTSCHNDGKGGTPATPTWDSAASAPGVGDDCTICHGATSATLTTSGSHEVHLSSSLARGPYGDGTGSTNCGECHAANTNNTGMGGYSTHIDGAADFVGGDGTLANSTGCNNCHGNASSGGAAAITTAKANWTSKTAVTCESCHGDYDAAVIRSTPAPLTAGTNYDTWGHGRTTGNAPNRACSDCHNAASVHINAAPGENRLVTQGGFNFETGGQENSYCNTCHVTVGGMFAHYANTQTPGGASDDGLYCYVCHEPHGTSGYDAMVRDTIQGRAVAAFPDRTVGSSYQKAGFDGVCQVCHDAEVGHYDRAQNDGHNAGAACTGCHDHTLDPGFQASAAGCTGCHGDGGTIKWPQIADPALGNYPNRIGKHLEHVSAIALAYFGTDNETNRNASCDFCHLDPGGPGHDTDNAPLKAADVTNISHILTKVADIDEVVNGQGTVHVTCSTVDCHFNNAVTPHWYDDDIPPGDVTLNAEAGPNPRSIKIWWLAPGDDGQTPNTTAYAYDMRYGTSSAIATNFGLTTNYVGGLPAAYKQGEYSEVVVENLDPDTTYYFSLKTRDTAGNWPVSAGPVKSSSAALPDTKAPDFGGADKASKGDEGGSINLYWTAAEDHSMPITYDIWLNDYTVDPSALDMSNTSDRIITGWTDTKIELNSLNSSTPITNDHIYFLGVRACDDLGNCDVNTQQVSVTPTAQPTVDKTYHSYQTANSTAMVKDGATGSGGSATISTSPTYFVGGTQGHQVKYFADTFALELDPGNNTPTLTAQIGSYNGSTFVGGKSVVVGPLGKRSKRVYQFKIVDTSGVTVPAGQSIAIKLTATGSTVAAAFGSAATRGDLSLAEQIINAAPTTATNNGTSLTGAIVDIRWNAATDTADGLDGVAGRPLDLVHYDLYGSNNGGTSFDYVIAEGLDDSHTSYLWDTQSAGIISGSLAVRINAGDGYTHTTTPNITGLGSADSTDYVAPSAIDDLTAKPRPKSGSVWLTWSAPGDDYGNHGRAAYYEIRSSESVITEGNFAAARLHPNAPSPDFGGKVQNYEVTDLTAGTPYYFAIKAFDEESPANESPISTAKVPGVSDQAVGGPRCGMCHTTAPSVTESVGNHKLHGFTINDCTKCHGAGVASYSLAHQDGSLVMGYGPGGPVEGVIGGNTITYTDPTGPTYEMYKDTSGFGGFGTGDYVPAGDGTDNGTCSNFGAMGVGGCHGSANSDPDGGGDLPTYPTPKWDDVTTLVCSSCHGNPNRDLPRGNGLRKDDFYGREFDAANPADGVVPMQILGAPSVDNHGNFDETGGGTEAQRKYIGQHEKHLNYSFRFSKGDSCSLCHAGDYKAKLNIDGKHANGEIDVQLDTNAAGPNAEFQWGGYPGVEDPALAGTCMNMSPESCHPGTATPKWDSAQNFDCVQCHGMAGVVPTHVTDPAQGITDIGPTGDAGLGANQMPGNCTWCHFGGHPLSDLGGTGLILENSSQVGINYRSGGIHMKKSPGVNETGGAIGPFATEAELCWGCHDTNGISEWGADDGNPNVTTVPNNASDYNYGQIYSSNSYATPSSNWTTGWWKSPVANFDYKKNAIQSTHSTNEAGTSTVTGSMGSYSETPDVVGNIRCSNCHDVHNLNKADGDTKIGAPYLRGTWIRNPYPEDGAPWSKNYTSVNKYGMVPRGGVANNELGGFQIDQNNNSPTAGLSLASSGGLCTLCHGTTIDTMNKNPDNFWVGTNGHTNSALGSTGSVAANIFGDGIGGRPVANSVITTGTSRTLSDLYNMGLSYVAANGSATSRGHSYRSKRYSAYNSTQQERLASDYAHQDFDWGVSMDNVLPEVGFHAFTCSKCHNPHASRLPKLMITNCLDTRHNTWDDSGSIGYGLQSDWTSATDKNENTATWATAQNCHRYDSVDNVGGWNTVTPW